MYEAFELLINHMINVSSKLQDSINTASSKNSVLNVPIHYAKIIVQTLSLLFK